MLLLNDLLYNKVKKWFKTCFYFPPPVFQQHHVPLFTVQMFSQAACIRHNHYNCHHVVNLFMGGSFLLQHPHQCSSTGGLRGSVVWSAQAWLCIYFLCLEVHTEARYSLGAPLLTCKAAETATGWSVCWVKQMCVRAGEEWSQFIDTF